MMQLSQTGIYESSFFTTIPNLAHGFTTKHQGNMSNVVKALEYFQTIHIAPAQIVMQKQIHGSLIREVKVPHEGQDEPLESDGLIYKRIGGLSQPMLVVRVGDCLPIVFVDPKESIIAVAHSGWRGTLEHISKKMIDAFISLGSDASSIHVAIGPSICGKCYSVPKERATLFPREVVIHGDDGYTVDLARATMHDLKSVGILEKHIEYDRLLCTLERKELFYSFRRKTESFGEIMGYIGYTA